MLDCLEREKNTTKIPLITLQWNGGETEWRGTKKYLGRKEKKDGGVKFESITIDERLFSFLATFY